MLFDEVLAIIEHAGIDEPRQRRQLLIISAGSHRAGEIVGALFLGEILVEGQRPACGSKTCNQTTSCVKTSGVPLRRASCWISP